MSALNRCSGSTWVCLRPSASRCAPTMASCAFSVNLSRFICPCPLLGRAAHPQVAYLGLQSFDVVFQFADVVSESHDDFDPREIDPHLVRQPTDLTHPLQVVQRIQPDAAF